MKKLTRYHIKHMQHVAQDVISEYIMNTLIRPNGATSFVMTFKGKESSQFLFFSEILIISFWYQSRKIFELFCLFPSIVPTACHGPGHTELLFCFLSLCPNLFYGNSDDEAALLWEPAPRPGSLLSQQGLPDTVPSGSLS